MYCVYSLKASLGESSFGRLDSQGCKFLQADNKDCDQTAWMLSAHIKGFILRLTIVSFLYIV